MAKTSLSGPRTTRRIPREMLAMQELNSVKWIGADFPRPEGRRSNPHKDRNCDFVRKRCRPNAFFSRFLGAFMPRIMYVDSSKGIGLHVENREKIAPLHSLE